MTYRPDVVLTPYQEPAGPIAHWTERRLRKAFENILQQVSIDDRVCLFIDGLDEFEGDQEELVEHILDVTQGTEVKACVSSRPSPEFGRAFASSAKLRLQDLTEKDIQKYVSDELGAVSKFKAVEARNRVWLTEIGEAISVRAQGVFLWVNLAVKDQRTGFNNGDSYEQLQQRLARLPDAVEGIYKRMLEDIDEPYRKEACRYLQIVVDHDRMSLVGIALMCHPGLDQMIESLENISLEDTVVLLRPTWERLHITCAGLLECRDLRSDDNEMSILDASTKTTEDTARAVFFGIDVRFSHRTAHAFMKHAAQGGGFLEGNTTLGFDHQASHTKFLIVKLQLLGLCPRAAQDLNSLVISIICNVAKLEERCGTSQMRLYEITHSVMRRIDPLYCKSPHQDGRCQGEIQVEQDKAVGGRHKREDPDWDLHTPWCMRWGPHGYNVMPLSVAKSHPVKRSKSPLSYRFPSYSVLDQRKSHCSGLAMPVDPVSFLGLATWLQARLYAQQRFECVKDRIDPRTATNLAICAIRSYPLYRRLLVDCINSGVEPNARVDDHGSYPTLWEFYLGYRYHLIPPKWYNDSNLQHNRAIVGDELMAFIENEANVDAITVVCNTREITSNQWLPQKEALDRELKKRMYCRFFLEISVLAFIQLRGRAIPTIRKIEEKCLAEGAQLHYQCLKVEINVFLDDHPADVKRPYYLSEQQSAKCIEIIDEDKEFMLGDGPMDPQIAEKLVQLFNELELQKRQAGNDSNASDASSVGTASSTDDFHSIHSGDQMVLDEPQSPLDEYSDESSYAERVTDGGQDSIDMEASAAGTEFLPDTESGTT